MNRLICWIMGHRWHRLSDEPGYKLTEGTYYLVRCVHCGEIRDLESFFLHQHQQTIIPYQ